MGAIRMPGGGAIGCYKDTRRRGYWVRKQHTHTHTHGKKSKEVNRMCVHATPFCSTLLMSKTEGQRGKRGVGEEGGGGGGGRRRREEEGEEGGGREGRRRERRE